jgi:hypothetical protein
VLRGAWTKGVQLIEFFTFGSTHGHKVATALEELGLPYDARVMNVFAARTVPGVSGHVAGIAASIAGSNLLRLVGCSAAWTEGRDRALNLGLSRRTLRRIAVFRAA